jgi:hypothetical protein
MLWLLLCLSVLAPLVPALAENRAVALYGLNSPGMQPRCEASKRMFDGLPAIRLVIVDNTFGNEMSCYESYMADPRTSAIEIHLNNEVCTKYPRCGSYELEATLTDRLWRSLVHRQDAAWMARVEAFARAAAERYMPALMRRTDVDCYFSPLLESRLSPADGQLIFNRIWQYWSPRCHAVWNGRGKLTGTIKEVHGKSSADAGEIAVMDGEDAINRGPNWVRTWFQNSRRAVMAAIWIDEFNGGYAGKFVDPRLRTKWPSGSQFREVNKMLRTSQ